MRVVGLSRPASSSSSIFSRLGDKDDEKRVKSILKSSPSSKKPAGIVKTKPIKPSQQKVMLVRKIPAKAVSMVADEYDLPHKMETGEKTVSFSEEDEVVEIAPRPRIQFKGKKPIRNRIEFGEYFKLFIKHF